MSGGECISLHIGQAGVRMGAESWEQYCHEQNISPDGNVRVPEDKHRTYTRSEELFQHVSPQAVTHDEWRVNMSDPLNNFFTETSSGRWSPRALFADLDPDVRSDIKSHR